jgi:hypothetical protein
MKLVTRIIVHTTKMKTMRLTELERLRPRRGSDVTDAFSRSNRVPQWCSRFGRGRARMKLVTRIIVHTKKMKTMRLTEIGRLS